MNSTDVTLSKNIPLFKEEMIWCVIDYMEKEWYSKISPSKIYLYDSVYDVLRWVLYSYMQDMETWPIMWYWPEYIIKKYEKAKQWIDLMIYTLVHDYSLPIAVDWNDRSEKERDINNRAKDILKYIVLPYLQH